MDKMTGVVRFLQKEKDRLTKELHGVTAALAAFGEADAKKTGTRKLSMAARGGSPLRSEHVGPKFVLALAQKLK